MSQVGRALGTDVGGNYFWGTHMCQLFQTKEDLIEVLVPYFKAGLQGNESCIWVTTKPLEVEEARAALYGEVANIDDYIAKKQIEILDYRDWYVREGVFDPDAVLQSWVAKESLALGKGFNGLRVSGNMAWY